MSSSTTEPLLAPSSPSPPSSSSAIPAVGSPCKSIFIPASSPVSSSKHFPHIHHLHPPHASPPSLSILPPLPEEDPLLSFPVPSTPLSSYKDHLIFGPPLPPSDHPSDSFPSISPSSPSSSSSTSWLTDPTSAVNRPFSIHRSRTAPAIPTLSQSTSAGSSSSPSVSDPRPPKQPAVVRGAVLLLLAYLAFGVAVYAAAPDHFESTSETHPVVDALYFCIVTMCTIGYGDITPDTPFAKLFSITFVLVGFGFVDILLSGMVSYVLDLQESLLLHTAGADDFPSYHKKEGNHHNRHELARRYIIDVKKGRMRIRWKVSLALCVVAICVGVGVGVLRLVEKLDWLDAFYLAVMSVTTVGYGDRAFKTMQGRLFASVWLLVSTLAVARAFLYLAELRIDRRHRKIAKWVLSRDMSVSDFNAADMDHDGYVTKSDYAVYKLKVMGKISDKDVKQVLEQFDKLDTGKCGKITLADLIESHHLAFDSLNNSKKGIPS